MIAEGIAPETLAQRFATLGAKTFPIRIDQDDAGAWRKRPLTPRGHLNASSDPQIVADMFFAAENANGVGVATGANGIVVLDIDRHEGGADGYATLADASIAVPESPARYSSVSGRGEHVIFAAPEGLEIAPGNLMPGVDVKAGSSWVAWNGDAPASWSFPVAPEWMHRRRSSVTFEPGVGLSAEQWIAGHPGEPAGTVVAALASLPEHGSAEWSNDRLVPLALGIVRAADWAAGGAAARSEFIARYASGPWATAEYRGAAARAFDRAISVEGMPEPLFTESPQLATVTPIAAHPRVRQLSALMQKEFAPLDWVVPGVIPEGTTLVVSPPKAGKSWLVLDIALAAATGGEALGGIAVGDRRPVLYVDLESGERRFQDRVRKQGWTSYGNFEYLLEREGAMEVIAEFMQRHEGGRPLVVLDTLAGVMEDKPKDRTQYKHEYETLAEFQRLTKSDPGSAFIIAHHTRKMTGDDPMDRVSGTNGIAGAVDTPIVLDRPDRHSPDGVLNVMARDFEGGEFAMTLRDLRWQLIGGDAAEAQREHERASSERERAGLGAVAHGVLQLVESDASRLWSVEDIVNTYQGTSGRETITRTLNRLASGGQIHRVSRGVYAALADEVSVAA